MSKKSLRERTIWRRAGLCGASVVDASERSDRFWMISVCRDRDSGPGRGDSVHRVLALGRSFEAHSLQRAIGFLGEIDGCR